MGRRVLIVDDDGATVERLEEALRRVGLDPRALTGALGLAGHLERHPPSIVLLASDLPEVESALRQIRGAPNARGVPLLFYGHGRPGELVRSPSDALARGGDYFFKLPTDYDYMAGRVFEWLRTPEPEPSRAGDADLSEAPADLEAFASARPHPHPALDAIRRRQDLVAEDPRAWAWSEDLDEEAPAPLPGPVDAEPEPAAGGSERPTTGTRSTPPDLAFGTKSSGGRALVEDARALERAGQLPDAVEAYATAATLFQMDGELERALRTYAHALSLEPRRVDLADATVDLLVAEGRTAEAVTLLSEAAHALETGGDPAAAEPLRARLRRLRGPSSPPGRAPEPELSASAVADVELEAEAVTAVGPRPADVPPAGPAARAPESPSPPRTAEASPGEEPAPGSSEGAVEAEPERASSKAEPDAEPASHPEPKPASASREADPNAETVSAARSLDALPAADPAPKAPHPEPKPASASREVDPNAETVSAARSLDALPAADPPPKAPHPEPKPASASREADPNAETVSAARSLEALPAADTAPEAPHPEPKPASASREADPDAETVSAARSLDALPAADPSPKAPHPEPKPASVSREADPNAETVSAARSLEALPAADTAPEAASRGTIPAADTEADDGPPIPEARTELPPREFADPTYESFPAVAEPEADDEPLFEAHLTPPPPDPRGPDEPTGDLLPPRATMVPPALQEARGSEPDLATAAAAPVEREDAGSGSRDLIDAAIEEVLSRDLEPIPPPPSPEPPERAGDADDAWAPSDTPYFEADAEAPEAPSEIELEAEPAPEPDAEAGTGSAPPAPGSPGAPPDVESPPPVSLAAAPASAAPDAASVAVEPPGRDAAPTEWSFSLPPAAGLADLESTPDTADVSPEGLEDAAPSALGLPPIPAATPPPAPDALPFDAWLRTDAAREPLPPAEAPIDAPELDSIPPLSVAPAGPAAWSAGSPAAAVRDARFAGGELVFRGPDAARGRIEHPADAVDLLITLDRDRCTGLLIADGLPQVVFVHGQARDLRGEEAFESALWGWTAPRGATESSERRDGRDGLRRALRRHARTYGLSRQACDLAATQALSQVMVQLMLLDGEWRFEPPQPPIRPDDLLPTGLETPDLLVGWVAQAWPTDELVAAVGGPKARLKVSTRAPVPRQADLRRLFRALDGQRTFEQARREAHVAPARAAAQAAVWVWSGWTGPTRPPEPAPPEPASTPAPSGPGVPPWGVPPMAPPWMAWPGAMPGWSPPGYAVAPSGAPSAPPAISTAPSAAALTRTPHPEAERMEPSARIRHMAELARHADYFRVLDVPEDAGPEAVTAAHAVLVQRIAQAAPAADPGLAPVVRELLRTLDEARDVLTVPELRQAYRTHRPP